MRVLVTRPQADAARTAARLAALGHEPIVDPLLAVVPTAVDRVPAGPFDALAATSANGARMAGATVAFDFLRTVPLYAVGTHTADAAREAGFKNVVVADGDAAALSESLARLGPGSRVLHLAGEDRARDLAGILSRSGVSVEVIVLYRMRPSSALAQATVAALSQRTVDAVLHFSARSAATFTTLVKRDRLEEVARGPRHLCISQSVAEGLAPLGVRAECAARPTEVELVALLGR